MEKQEFQEQISNIDREIYKLKQDRIAIINEMKKNSELKPGEKVRIEIRPNTGGPESYIGYINTIQVHDIEEADNYGELYYTFAAESKKVPGTRSNRKMIVKGEIISITKLEQPTNDTISESTTGN